LLKKGDDGRRPEKNSAVPPAAVLGIGERNPHRSRLFRRLQPWTFDGGLERTAAKAAVVIGLRV
jgi:hypothetical protein